jgi:DNA-binding transcriptional ArsR family regulator
VAAAVPTRRLEVIPTGGVFSDPAQAGALRDHMLPPTASQLPQTRILDLRDAQMTSGALREFILPLGQQLRGGVYGDIKVILVTDDEAATEAISLLAREHGLPLFLARGSSASEIAQAEPAGDLTQSERDTLDELRSVGGGATVSALAGAVGLPAPAVNNRLASLERKGYVYRFRRGRRYGDLYIDPRVSLDALVFAALDRPEIPPPRTALLARGIRSNPYDRMPFAVDEEAAKRADEILRRRGKA